MKLPETICIGYQDIEVLETDFPEGEQGVYLADKTQIRIQEGLSIREHLNTVLHECLHAIFCVYGAKSLFENDEKEEQIVGILGNGLAELFSRNPELAKWVAYHAGR